MDLCGRSYCCRCVCVGEWVGISGFVRGSYVVYCVMYVCECTRARVYVCEIVCGVGAVHVCGCVACVCTVCVLCMCAVYVCCLCLLCVRGACCVWCMCVRGAC